MLTKLAVLGPSFRTLLLRLWEAARDLLPIILVIVLFQGLVLRQPCLLYTSTSPRDIHHNLVLRHIH